MFRRAFGIEGGYPSHVNGVFGRREVAAMLGIGGGAMFASAVAGACPPSLEVEERNKATIRAKVARLNAGDIPGYLRFYTADFSNFGRVVGPSGAEPIIRDIVTTFPDWNMSIQELVADKDIVAGRFTVSGTHRGVAKTGANGGLLKGVPPTGKSFTVQHIHWYRLKAGKVAAHTAVRDDLGMMMQLGLIKAS
jgi:predicted ester cyclase